MTVLRIKRANLSGMAYVLATCLALLGSAAYIYTQSLACGTVIVIIGGFFLSVAKFKVGTAVGKRDLPAYAALVLLFCFSVIAFAVYRTYPNAQYMKSFAFNMFAFICVSSISVRRFRHIDMGVMFFLVIVLAVSAMQATYLFWGFGLDPVQAQSADYVVDNAYSFSGIRSIFMNPNDLSLVCCLLLVYFTQVSLVSERIKLAVVSALAVVIVLSASRTCILVGALIVAMYYLKRPRQWVIFAACLLTLWVSLNAAANSGGGSVSDSYWGKKIASISVMATNFVNGGARDVRDGSVDERSAGYSQFLGKFDLVGFGSFKAQDYGYLMKGDALFQENPHSLPVELSLLYGYAGAMIFVLFMGWIFLSLMDSDGIWYAASFAAIYFMLTFVSSSEINFPSFWILTFLIVMGPRKRGMQMPIAHKGMA